MVPTSLLPPVGRATADPGGGLPPDYLNNGDRLTQKEFHALYERMPENVHAELIEGTVYMSSPLRVRHGSSHPWLTTAFVYYMGHTPGVQVCDNTTVILGNESEPQPDLLLRVLPEYGGRTGTTSTDFITGPPELIVEVADSTRSLDLGDKQIQYARNGVLEYLVLNVQDARISWYDLAANRSIEVDPDGVIRVRTFPGLWIHVEALLRQELTPLLATLDRGLATPEHAAFVAKLAAAKRD
jgi:Uma2 family endonuclease